MVHFESIVFIIGLMLMYFSSKWSVHGAIKMSKALGLKTFAIGFIFISISTSFPELFVTILSSIRGEAGLAMGNIFGSNLSNITLILGLTIILGGAIYLTKKDVIDLIELMFVTTLIPLFLILRDGITWIHGTILITLFAFYMYKVSRSNVDSEVPPEKKSFIKFIANLIQFLTAVGVLLIGSELIVRSAISIATEFGVSAALIGVTIVAIGTSLPELFVGIQSVRGKEYGLALGNLFGSGIVNFTLVLGTLALFSPQDADISVIGSSVPYLILATMGIWYIISKKEKLNIWVGIGLVFLYAAFIIQELGFFGLVGI